MHLSQCCQNHFSEIQFQLSHISAVQSFQWSLNIQHPQPGTQASSLETSNLPAYHWGLPLLYHPGPGEPTINTYNYYYFLNINSAQMMVQLSLPMNLIFPLCCFSIFTYSSSTTFSLFFPSEDHGYPSSCFPNAISLQSFPVVLTWWFLSSTLP